MPVKKALLYSFLAHALFLFVLLRLDVDDGKKPLAQKKTISIKSYLYFKNTGVSEDNGFSSPQPPNISTQPQKDKNVNHTHLNQPTKQVVKFDTVVTKLNNDIKKDLDWQKKALTETRQVKRHNVQSITNKNIQSNNHIQRLKTHDDRTSIVTNEIDNTRKEQTSNNNNELNVAVDKHWYYQVFLANIIKEKLQTKHQTLVGSCIVNLVTQKGELVVTNTSGDNALCSSIIDIILRNNYDNYTLYGIKEGETFTVRYNNLTAKSN
jgi:hypothetical protein